MTDCDECRFFHGDWICCERNYGAMAILNTIGNCDNFEPGKYDPYNLESTKGDNKPC